MIIVSQIQLLISLLTSPGERGIAHPKQVEQHGGHSTQFGGEGAEAHRLVPHRGGEQLRGIEVDMNIAVQHSSTQTTADQREGGASPEFAEEGGGDQQGGPGGEVGLQAVHHSSGVSQ